LRKIESAWNCALYKIYDAGMLMEIARIFYYDTNLNTTPWAIKKRATFIFTITLANVDRFQ